MEYEKIINFFENETTQPSKARTKNLVEINDQSMRLTILNSRQKC